MKICSLLPSTTEIVCALGLEEELVAITHECDFPASILDKPVVTRSLIDHSNSNSSEINTHISEALHNGSGIYEIITPVLDESGADIILTQELCEVCAVSYSDVEKSIRQINGNQKILSFEPNDLNGILESIEQIGHHTNTAEMASKVTKTLKSRIEKVKTKSKSKTPLVAVIALALIFGLFGIYYFANIIEEKPSIETTSIASSKPSILVTPIKTSGLQANQEAFGTGITESMITTLSQYKAIRVLSSNTSFHVAKTEMLDAEIRDQYGVDFLIRGSIQVMGSNARLNLEISDLKLEEVTISKKRDFELSKVFKVQDELSNEILNEMQINLGVGSRQGKRWASNWKSIEDFTKFLNWRNELRNFTKESHLNSQRILEELKDLYPEESDLMYVAEAWQTWQRIVMQISTDKEKDLERLNFITNKAIELNPESADAYAVRAFVGFSLLNTGCEAALTNVIKAEESGSTADTLQIVGRVYALCGDLKKAIRSSRNALKLVPNDTGWFVTGALVINLYETGQIEEIYKLIGKNIQSNDMEQRVLAIYAFLEHKKGNKELAEEYLSRAKNNGFSRVRLERLILNKELREETIKGLMEIGTLE